MECVTNIRATLCASFRATLLSLFIAVLLPGCVGGSSKSNPNADSPPAVKPDLQFTSSAASLVLGDSVTLNWAATNASGCVASGAWSGQRAVQGTETITPALQHSSYTLTCDGAGGSAAKEVVVTVANTTPTVTLTADPTSIAYNARSTLSWSSTGATQCQASGAWSGAQPTSGSATTAALTISSTFTLTCSGDGGVASSSVTVAVAAPPPTQQKPVVSITASPTTVAYNASSTLSWSSTNATACEASGAWSGTQLITGSLPLTALKNSGTYTLTCTGAGGSTSQSVTINVQAPLPTVTLNASATTIAYNGSVTLSWSSTDAASCTASGAWAGAKTTADSQLLSMLTASGTYSLTCTGSGGSASKSVIVTVQPPVPTLTLAATPTSVATNGSTSLTWTSSAATTCNASGGWTGAKATSGSETLSGLVATNSYVLTCTGAGGNASQTVTVTVTAATGTTVFGSVDSSLINRAGVNKVYLFAGAVTPDDYDGDAGDPIASALVSQDAGACSFSYSFSSVAAGTYTIAFTNQAANDIANQNNTITFVGTATISVGASPYQKDFTPARILRVGTGKAYSKPSAAYAAALSGDVIEIDAGVYQDDVVVWRQNNITLRGVGGRAHIKGTQVIPYVPGDDAQNGMALWVTNGSNAVIENIEFSGAQVTDQNGAGIRANGNGLVVCNGYFHDNEDGILGGAGEVLIEYSEFDHNGIVGDGYTHNLYMDTAVTKFVFRYNYSHRAHIGHELKTRAVENYILYNRLMDEDGDGSYTVDVPNGGLTYLIGNLIQQGPNTDNSIIVNYGAEGLLAGRVHRLYLVNNTLVNDRSGGTFVYAASGSEAIVATNDLFVGTGTDISGPAAAITRTSNLVTTTAILLNQAGYDYHLITGSAAIDRGTDPGIGNGFDLRPQYQYLNTARREARPSVGAWDIGAYEYVP